MPGKVNFCRAEDDAVEKGQRFVVAGFEPLCFRSPFGKDFPRYPDSVGVGHRPKSLVEHPVRIARERKSVLRTVVLGLRKPVNVRRLDKRCSLARMDPVSCQPAGEPVLRDDDHPEPGIPTLRLVIRRVFFHPIPKLPDFRRDEAKGGVERGLFEFRKPRLDKNSSSQVPPLAIVQDLKKSDVQLDRRRALRTLRPLSGLRLGNPESLRTQMVERQIQIRLSAPPGIDDPPIRIKPEPQLRRLPESPTGNLPGVCEVDQAEQEKRLVRREPRFFGTLLLADVRVQLAQFGCPKIRFH